MKQIGLKEAETVDEVFCDVCGESCKKRSHGEDAFEFATITADWGYFSKHDGQNYEIHLCEDCFFQTIANLREARRGHRMFESDSFACDKDPLAEQ